MATKQERLALKDIETTVKVLSSMPYDARVKFVNNIDQFQNLHGDALIERISKATAIQYGLMAAWIGIIPRR